MLSIISEIFYWILNISLAGSLVSVFIIVYRKFFKYNYLINTFLWTVLSIRLILPFSYITRFSILELYRVLGLRITTTAGQGSLYFSNIVSQAITYSPIAFKSDFVLVLFQVLSIVWVIGIVLILIFWYLSFRKINIILKRGTLLGEIHSLKVYETSQVQNPFIYGILHPIVIVPKNFNTEDLEIVMNHERAHYKHFDNLKRFFALLICMIHWFNPLVWMSFKVFSEDLEIEADRQAIAWMGKDKKQVYLTTLVRLSTDKTTIVGSTFSTHPLVRRVQTQMDIHEIKYKFTWLFVVIGILTILVLLANT